MSEITFTDANFDQEVLKSSSLVMVDFFAPWCGPCKMMAPAVDKLASEMSDVKIGKLNVDDNLQTGTRYDIRSIPTVIFFKGGEVVGQLIGFQSEDALRKQIEALK